MNKITIRKATKKYIDKIDEICHEGVFDEVKLQFPKKSNKDILEELNKWKKDRIKGFVQSLDNKKGILIISLDRDKIIGFGEAKIQDYDKRKAEITKVYILKDYRRNSVGSKIIFNLLRWLKSNHIKSVSVGIFVKNKASIGLCKKFGFKITAVRLCKELK